jgi:hypothetical protein
MLISDYQKGWALRYIREARAELTAAQKTPYLAPSLVIEAMRKAQVAIYYSLGEPAFVEGFVHEAIRKNQFVTDPILKCLVEIELSVQQLIQMPEANQENAMEQASGIIQIASDIVKLFTNEPVD